MELVPVEIREKSQLYATLRAWRGGRGRARFGEPEYKLLPAFVSSGDTVIDVGANLGVYTWRLAALVGRRGRVISIEPNPQLATMLETSARHLRLSQIQVEAVACADKPGVGSLVIPTNHGRADIGQARLGEGGIPVHVTTLDLLVPDAPVQFIKIDAEGGEAKVLRGAERILERDHPTLLLELQEMWASRLGASAQATMDDLRERGYTACVYRDGSLKVTHGVDSAITNYIFLPAA